MNGSSILYLVVSLANAYVIVIFVYILMSWIPEKRGIVADVDDFLARICEPYLSIFRRFIPPLGMIDISPIVAVLVLQFGAMLLMKL